MPIDSSSKFTDYIIYILVGVTTLLFTLIGILYNMIWKNLNKLWDFKDIHDKKIMKNDKEIGVIKATCEERHNKGKK